MADFVYDLGSQQGRRDFLMFVQKRVEQYYYSNTMSQTADRIEEWFWNDQAQSPDYEARPVQFGLKPYRLHAISITNDDARAIHIVRSACEQMANSRLVPCTPHDSDDEYDTTTNQPETLFDD